MVNQKNIVVLVSGRGSNLKALLSANISAEFVLVVSNNPDIPALEIAKQYHVPSQVVNHRHYSTAHDFEAALIQLLEDYEPSFIILAGFMKILSRQFVTLYQGKLINIHPSLLPDFPGIKTHERVLAAGRQQHGCTVHFVTEQVDKGPIILQSVLPVYKTDTINTLADRVLEAEHCIYPLAVQWLVTEKVCFNDF